MTFETARTWLNELLSAINWPQNVIWVRNSRFLVLPAATARDDVPARLALFQPPANPNDDFAKREYQKARRRGLLVRLEALGKTENGVTYARIDPTREPGAGEVGVIGFTSGAKVMAASSPPLVTAVQSRLSWFLLKRSLKKWIRQRDRALRAA